MEPREPQSPESAPAQPDESVREEGFGPRNWALFLLGVLLLIAGYVFLARAGREAADVWGRLAPYFIVGGYAVFGLGFVPREKEN